MHTFRFVIFCTVSLLLCSVAHTEDVQQVKGMVGLEAAFEVESKEQLGLSHVLEEPSEIELLKRENEQLKQRVSELEQRLTAVEKTLAVGE